MNRTIVINATNLGRYIDGIGVYVLNLLRELAQLKSDHPFIIYLNRSAAEHVGDIQFPDNYEVRWISSVLSPDHGFKGHFLRLMYSNYLGLKHMGSVIFVASQLEAIMFRRDQIITIHDIIPLLFGKLHKKQYYYFKFVLPHVLKRTRCVITPSHHTKSLLSEKYSLDASKIQVIHNGVCGSLFADTQRRTGGDDGKFILFSGRLVPMKNLPGVLHAFSLIKDKVPHNIVITGHDRKRSSGSVAAYLDEYSLDPGRVEFKGHVSERKMDELLNQASLVVFPSFYEGFGLPPLEGMAHGCPVVVSNVASLPEVCGDAAEYVDPSNVQSIAEGMYRVLTNGSVRGQLVERGLKRSKLFSWKESARQHLEVFDHAIDSAGTPSPIYGVQAPGFAVARQYPIPIWRSRVL